MKQTVEESADEYMKTLPVRAAIKCGDIEDLESHIKVAFKSGAEWQSNQSPWISVEEQLPPIGVDVIHTNIDTGRIYYGPIIKVGALILGYTPYGEITATHYMVVPKFPFDEILKSEQRCDGTN